MYPILFKPIYRKTIWGGNGLRIKYNRDIPNDNIGQSLDISCQENEMSIIENGELAGKTFEEFIKMDKEACLGKNFSNIKDFPLLIKIIDAKDDLSVQVHPNNEYAILNENLPFGKYEMWYILDAPENAYLIIGLDDNVTKEIFNAAILNKNTKKCLNKLYIKKGDVINIPAGLVHAITKGVMLAEIQQNSDTTYRIYDYDRLGLDGRPRDLHIKKAIDVIDFENKISKEVISGLTIIKSNAEITYYIANQYFAIEKYNIKKFFSCCTDYNKFLIFTCLEGSFIFESNNDKVELCAGRTIFLPAALGEFVINGKGILLKSYIPDIKEDFISPLIKNGYSIEDINLNTSIN